LKNESKNRTRKSGKYCRKNNIGFFWKNGTISSSGEYPQQDFARPKAVEISDNGGLTIANGVRGDGESFDAERNFQVNGGISGGTTVNGYNSGGTYTGGTMKSFSL
jgi:hypothetical protein